LLILVLWKITEKKQIKLLTPQENDITLLVRQSYPHCLCRQSRAGIRGSHQRPHEEIANRGGGILNSAKSSTKQLKRNTIKERLEEVMRLGTGAIEIKSGYGLTIDGELKCFG
jgi:hypothetical protein